ncbi:enoyl-CoA hydratase/isomerase family protein [Jatrophihabitans sp.]|uniref:enoyl-CoA hydratase/isomerase family protein n=1 Tax=Jatrophihabitans sp. TaxID=1932789 RepID=UPI0030C72DF7|nr:enoyl-CoA hydratase [Jatrophihabitans sp.]
MSNVLLTIDKGVAEIRLNRPDALNSLSLELLDDLEAALVAVRADSSVRVAVISGAGRAFCTGGDLKTISRLFDVWPEYVKYLYRLTEVMCLVEDLPIPTIARVHGYALAGGLELLLCCDLAIATEGARIGDQHSNFGLIAGAGGIPRLVRRIGKQSASELLFTGRWLTGAQAAEVGIVLKAVPDAEIDAAINELAASLTSKSRMGLTYTKRAIAAGLDVPLETALNEERSALLEYFSTSPHPREGVRAFIEKREPNFDD